MKNHSKDTDLFLKAVTRSASPDSLLLRVGLWTSLAMTGIAVAGVEILDRSNVTGIMLGAVATAWFLFRILTSGFAWTAVFGRVAGLTLLSALPAVFIVSEGLNRDPQVAASSWIPAQLFVIFIGFSIVRLKHFDPLWSSVTAAGFYLLAFGYLRSHVPLEVAATDPLHWELGLFRAATLVAWGLLGFLFVIGLRRLLKRAGKEARAGELIGKYRLGDELGRGGMGEVHRATYCPEGGFVSEVAIKRIHPSLALEPGMVDRFREEAEVGARLRHHNIVATLDFGRMEETFFLAMEFVDGESLRSLAGRAKNAGMLLPESLVAYVGKEVLRGLGFAHEVATCPQGRPLRVVHRDLCPNNLLISRAGHVKIADFGVAYALREAASGRSTGVIGKVGYVAPEVVRGDGFDARADLFAVGCILWELLTGKRAFKRDDTLNSLVAVVECDLAKTPGYASMSPRWKQFFKRALTSDPAARFASAQEMRHALVSVVSAFGSAEELAAWISSVDQPFVSLVRAPSEFPEPNVETGLIAASAA